MAILECLQDVTLKDLVQEEVGIDCDGEARKLFHIVVVLSSTFDREVYQMLRRRLKAYQGSQIRVGA